MPFILDNLIRLTRSPRTALAGLALIILTGCQSTEPASVESNAAPPTNLREAKASEVTNKQKKAAKEAFDDRVKALANFAAGLSSRHKRKNEEAFDHFLKSVKADPSNQKLALEVAQRLLRQQKLDEAIDVLEEVAKTKGAPGTIDALLGVAYRGKQQFKKARAACEESIRKTPGFILGYETLFQINNAEKKNDDAVAILHRAAAVKNASPNFLLDLARMFMDQIRVFPQYRDAEMPNLKKVLGRINGRRLRLTLDVERLAGIHHFAGDTKKAESLLRALQRANPGKLEYQEKIFRFYYTSGQPEAATRELDQLLNSQPTNARLNYLRGLLAAEGERWDEAAVFYRKAIQYNEQQQDYYFSLAGILLTADKSDDALKTLNRARKLFKPTFRLEYLTALAHSRKDDYATSVRHYQAAEAVAKKSQPDVLDHGFYFQMGATFERAKKYAEAAKIFRQVLKMKPDFPDALNYLGYMWAERGENLAEARAMIEKAIAAEPDNAAFLDSMGWVLYMMGQKHESIPWLVRAVELSDVEQETDPTLFDHLGDAYFAIGDYRKARANYQQAIKIKAKPEIQKKLDDTNKRLRN